jgi:cell division septation protein DedD
VSPLPTAPRAAAPARPAPREANAPLSLTPDAAPPSRPAAQPQPPAARVASVPPPTQLAPSPAPDAAPAPAARTGGYTVQVTSQRSEQDAQSAFRGLQGKYPGVLQQYQPIIRRADLGERGVYYRALVGPFASASDAGALCSALKAAGGQCVIQRN